MTSSAPRALVVGVALVVGAAVVLWSSPPAQLQIPLCTTGGGGGGAATACGPCELRWRMNASSGAAPMLPGACRGEALYLRALQLALTGVMSRSRTYINNNGSATGPHDLANNWVGKTWPVTGMTMVGVLRLQNVADLLADAMCRGVPGDFLEAGVWRGGTAAFAGAVIGSLGGGGRRVWLADSFAGLPPGRYAGVDDTVAWEQMSVLAVSLEDVAANVAAVGAPLPPDSFRFVRGFFNESMPRLRAGVGDAAGLGALAVLRMDGDTWESGMDILYSLYDRLSVGGFLIVDDGNLPPRRVVAEFLAHHGAAETLVEIDGDGFYLRKTRAFAVDRAYYAAQMLEKVGRVVPPDAAPAGRAAAAGVGSGPQPVHGGGARRRRRR